jgi:site-specific recombinase XerD
MSLIAPTMQMFFTERLAKQRQASPATVRSYRNTFKLLLRFVHGRTGKAPSALDWEDLSAEVVSAFLDHLEADRGNVARSRNARLAALRSLFRYAALRHPEHAELIARVLAIPQKRYDKAIVAFLEPKEIEALLAAPDRGRWEGRRDHALIAIAVQTGLRLSELTGLNCADVMLGTGAHVRCTGKGRKQRCVPLTTANVAILRVWLQERRGLTDEPLFPTRTGRRLSDDAVEARLATYKPVAAKGCPSLAAKTLTPHVLRHTCAMTLLRQGVDVAVIALWLGHADIRSTDPYLHADMTIKERALARMTTPSSPPGRYRPTDALIAFLESL